MLNTYFLLPIITLCVIGVYFSVKEFAAYILRNNIKSCVVIEVDGKADNIENAIRNVMSVNPQSEILIINKSDDFETEMILHHLSEDFEQIHIKKDTAQK